MSKQNERKAGRSGIQECDITGEPVPLVKHHMRGRTIKNYDADFNVAWVSATTHDLIHRGDIILEGWMMTSDGRALIWHKRNEQSITGNDLAPPTY